MRPIYALAFGRSLLWNLVFFFLPVLLMDRGIDATWRGVLLAILTASGATFSLVAGLLSDRLSPRPMIASGLLLCGLYLALLAGIHHPLGLLPAFLAGGVGLYLAQVATEAYVYKSIKVGREGRGVAGLTASLVLGMSLGLVLGGLLLDRLSALTLLGPAAVLFALIGLAAARCLAVLPAQRVAADLYLAELRQPRALWLLAFCFLTRLHWGVEVTCYTPYLREAYALDRTGSGLFMAGPILLLGAVSLWCGRALDRGWSRHGLLLGGVLVAGIGHIAFALTDSLWVSVAWRAIHEMGEALVLVCVGREVTVTFASEKLGGQVGSLALLSAFATAMGALIASPLGAAQGYALPNWIGGVLMVLAVWPALGLSRRARLSPAPAS